MKNLMKIFFYTLIVMALTLNLIIVDNICEAEAVTGQAAIVSGNIDNAKLMARYDAMRAYAEKEIGVYVNSSTEVELNMVVSDKISLETQGYVKVKKILKEWRKGDIYFVTFDLEATAKPISIAVEEVRDQLRMLPDSSTRKGIQVAVSGVGNTSANMQRINHYTQMKLQAGMEETGFNIFVNDEIRAYMSRHPDMSDYATSVEVRRIARNNRGAEDALLRGTLQTVNIRQENGYFIATVNASFELVGLNDNRVNSFSDYFTAVGNTSLEAENKALNLATKEATENLGKKAIEMINNSDFKNGIQATIVFSGIRNRNADEDRILTGLENANCQVINSSFTSTGEYKLVVKSTAYSSLHELRRAILRNISGLTTANDRENDLGAQKLFFTF
ncbi:MAG: flagellar assembly protein T N-terminal domain-containing protein [Selenomonadaceae bacterium]|nr:flagellar assembly protein T N-terminal domain-containing protein [Selenomonadaceae bacterium]